MHTIITAYKKGPKVFIAQINGLLSYYHRLEIRLSNFLNEVSEVFSRTTFTLLISTLSNYIALRLIRHQIVNSRLRDSKKLVKFLAPRHGAYKNCIIGQTNQIFEANYRVLWNR